MRSVLLTAALISACIATALGFRIIDLGDATAVEVNRLTQAWGFWALALLIAASFPWQRYDR